MAKVVGIVAGVALAAVTWGVGSFFLTMDVCTILYGMSVSMVAGGLVGLFNHRGGVNNPVTTSASVRQPAANWRVVYGDVQIGAVWSFVCTVSTGGYVNNVLHGLFTIAGHKIHAMSQLVVDGAPQALQPDTPADWELVCH